jgi:predicted signal transduction protein with EAL and GGDEF domain
LLVEVARRLRQAVRAVDTVARLAGDEFVVTCEGLDDLARTDAALEAVAERVRRALREPVVMSGRRADVTASVGIAVTSTPLDPEVILHHADAAMYDAKARGGDRRASHSGDALHERELRRRLEARLRSSVVTGEGLWMAYQPILDLRSGEVAAVEALARYDLDGVTIAPGTFLPVAEKASLMGTLGGQVLSLTLRELSELRDRCGRVSVNVSASQLVDGLEAEVAAALARTGWRPDRLVLEITETELMANAAQAAVVLRRLQRRGVQVAVDDFGTGYSSLAYLSRLPATALKIDRSFVSDLGSETGRAIVGAIVGLGEALGLRVVAEGVETDEQLATVRRLGCQDAQGFHIAAPMTLSELATWLDAPSPVAGSRA